MKAIPSANKAAPDSTPKTASIDFVSFLETPFTIPALPMTTATTPAEMAAAMASDIAAASRKPTSSDSWT